MVTEIDIQPYEELHPRLVEKCEMTLCLHRRFAAFAVPPTCGVFTVLLQLKVRNTSIKLLHSVCSIVNTTQLHSATNPRKIHNFSVACACAMTASTPPEKFMSNHGTTPSQCRATTARMYANQLSRLLLPTRLTVELG